MTSNLRNPFAPIGNFFGGMVDGISLAREVTTLYNMPDSAFRARGTTRDAAIRAAMARR